MNKVILITGTSTGLGLAIAVQAAQAGHIVYATMRDTDKRGRLDAAAKEAGVSPSVLQLDVQDSASVNAAVGAVIEAEGRIDVLVNNAGMGYARSLEQADEADIQKILDINYMGVVRCTRAVMPHMRQARARPRDQHLVGGRAGRPTLQRGLLWREVRRRGADRIHGQLHHPGLRHPLHRRRTRRHRLGIRQHRARPDRRDRRNAGGPSISRSSRNTSPDHATGRAATPTSRPKTWPAW